MIEPTKADKRIDAACWQVFEKRYSECTEAELYEVIAHLRAETARYERIAEEERERTAGYERRIASCLAVIDQYESAIAETLSLAELYANSNSGHPQK